MCDRYAIIENGIVTNVIVADESKASACCIQTDTAQMGDSYIDGIFVSPPLPNVFEFVVTNISINDAHGIVKPDFSSVLCKTGSDLTLTIEARVDGMLLPLNDYFRTPIIASDGREHIFLTKFVDGVCSATYIVPESGFWSISQAAINKNTDSATYFLFKGLNIDVIE